MDINDKTYILGYWFASDGENNWYLMMCKKDGKWEGQYTFRYNVGHDDPFMGVDEKSIYVITFEGDKPEQEVLDCINKMFSVIKLKFNDYYDHFLVQGGAEKFFKISEKKHYMHIRMVQ